MMNGKSKKIPTLVELCVIKAIDNLRYIGDVGEVDIYLLQDILPHCTVDQLMHIENSTEGRDLSSVTDVLWKRFYEKQFGRESMNKMVQEMKDRRMVVKWKRIYEAETKRGERLQKKAGERLKERYQAVLAEKTSRKTQFTNKAPDSSKKRGFWSGSSSCNVSHLKSNIMKKAKIESVNSMEAKNKAAMRKLELQRRSIPPQSISRPTKPTTVYKKDLPSSSKITKPTGGYQARSTRF